MAEEPKSGKGALSKIDKINGPLGIGFVGLDAYMGMKNGESAPTAIGSALVTNALWNMVPGGLVGGIALTAGMAAAQAAPEISRAMDGKLSEFNQNRNQFGGSFQSSQAQEAMASQGINRISQARSQASRRMANHARGAQIVY